MDILLLSITVVSVVIALVMSGIAWRLARDERARGRARIAALAAAARDDQPVTDTITPDVRPVPQPRAPWHTAAAAVAARDEFPREEWPLRTPERAPVTFKHESRDSRTATTGDLGESFLGSAVGGPASGGRQRGLALAAAALFVALLAGGYFTVFRAGDASEGTAAASASTSPLELISLRHERQAGSLAITGLVRNPSAGQPVGKLSAVVFLFDQQGSFITSSRAGIDYTQLAPGDESPFVIRLEAPRNVARYRVSFRTDEGVVPHVDRRGQEPIARDLP